MTFLKAGCWLCRFADWPVKRSFAQCHLQLGTDLHDEIPDFEQMLSWEEALGDLGMDERILHLGRARTIGCCSGSGNLVRRTP